MSVLRARICLAVNTIGVLVLMVSLAAAANDAAKAGPQATVTRLDGTTLTGELRSWDDELVILATPAGEQRIDTQQLMSLRWNNSPRAEKPASAMAESLAELTDGTLIPISTLRVYDKTAALAIPQLGDEKPKPIALPTTQLAAVRFQKLDPALAAQWDEIRRQNLTTDLLVVLKRDGKSLDYVEGVLGDITEDKVEFKLEGETNKVDRSKVAGIVYYRSERRTNAEPRVLVQGRSGLRASVAKMQFSDHPFTLVTTGGAELAWPIADIDFVDFSAGKIAYLSDIEPASEAWSPLVGLPTGLTLAGEYGRPRRDHSAFGGKLAVLMKESATAESPSPGLPRSFNKGLAVHSRTELVYRLPPGFSSFSAVAGIDPAASSSGNVRLVLFADDQQLFESHVASDGPPQSLNLKIAGVKRLKILVDFGQNQDSGDWLNLCDAKLVK